MKVENGLAGALAVVRDQAEICEPALARDRRGANRQSSEKTLVGRGNVGETRDVLLRDDQHVGRGLGRDVLEREHTLVFVDLLRGNLARDDPAEDAVGQVRFS